MKKGGKIKLNFRPEKKAKKAQLPNVVQEKNEKNCEKKDDNDGKYYQIQKITDKIQLEECTQCREIFEEVGLLLPCLHVLCLERCLGDLVEREEDEEPTCPFCGKLLDEILLWNQVFLNENNELEYNSKNFIEQKRREVSENF
ncbi:hypothetical protein SNEBB_011042 [Seison nebaliae]|nr:hypothetical protein SNEBB_011042 [Seison nebaliae]